MLRNFAGMVPHLFEVFVWGRWSGFHLARQLAQSQHADLLRRGFGDRAERFLCPPCLSEFIVELLLWMQGCVLIIKVVWYSIFLIISQFRKITWCTLHQFSWTFYLKFNKSTIRANLEASCACFWTTNVYLVGMYANHFTIPRYIYIYFFLVSEITIVQRICPLKKSFLSWQPFLVGESASSTFSCWQHCCYWLCRRVRWMCWALFIVAHMG